MPDTKAIRLGKSKWSEPTVKEARLEWPQVLVKDFRGLAMHHSTRSPHDFTTECLPYALVTHAHPKDWHVMPKITHSLKRDARVLWLSCRHPLMSSVPAQTDGVKFVTF